jgi:gas vesicle protein
MDNQDSKSSSQAVALAFLGGAVAGVVAGLLLAPKSGEETRRALKGYARRAEEEVLEKAKEARAALDETIERGKHFIAEKAADVEAAAKAGRETMKEKMDTCCS